MYIPVGSAAQIMRGAARLDLDSPTSAGSIYKGHGEGVNFIKTPLDAARYSLEIDGF